MGNTHCKFTTSEWKDGADVPKGTIAAFLVKGGAVVVLIYAEDGKIVECSLEQDRAA